MKSILYNLIFIIAVFFTIPVNSQTKEFTNVSENETSDGIEWMSITEAIEKNKSDQKKMLIDVYTNWCGWCKVLDKKTFANEHVAEYVNENFYPVKLNAEQKENIEFLGNTYQFNPQNKAHDLAIALLNGQMGYPKVVFLEVAHGDTPKANVIYTIGGFVEAKEFHQIASFFGDNTYLSTDWETFSKTYQSPIE